MLYFLFTELIWPFVTKWFNKGVNFINFSTKHYFLKMKGSMKE